MLRDALASRHIGKVIRAYRYAHDPVISQTTVGRWIGLTQGQVSRHERGGPVTDLHRLERWARALRVPERLLWFTLPPVEPVDDFHPVKRLILPRNLPLRRQVPDEGGDDVNRRGLLKAAGVTAAAAGSALLAASPWQRLTEATARGRAADDTTVELVEDKTSEFYQTEEVVPARQLLTALRQHRATIHALVNNTRRADLRSRLLVALGETDALTGWLWFDLNQPDHAALAWRGTLQLAEQVGDGPLAACALGYWSYLASARGATRAAIRMLVAAGERVRGSSAPATRSWIAVREAEERASLSEESEALRAVERAITAFDYAHPRTERPWTAFFTASRLGSSTVTTYNRLGHRDADATADSLLASLGPSENKVRALVLSDLALSAVRTQNFDRADGLASAALDLASRTEASLAIGRLRELRSALPRKRHSGTADQLRQRLAVLGDA
ncbi:helix-turn-helix domain-containing protein [Streptoalloteichus tenebrarius]|nr:helix-turn-helix transcriptional regulator [Streptoalloteichus tenebrarius]BFF01029.1 hypothetical protein GCM10020241_27040 [Streptoalloteichus tenebrarius]